MINGSEKRKRQLAFELESSRIFFLKSAVMYGRQKGFCTLWPFKG